MMMRQLMLYIGVLAATTACTKRFQEREACGATIDLYAQIDGETASKGVVLNNSSLTEMRLLRKDSINTPKDFSGITPLTASRTAAGAITFATTQNYDMNDKNAYFVGYHPAGSLSSNVVTWTIDGKTDIIRSSIYNAGKYTAIESNTMTFAHQLAQLEIVCKADPASSVPETDVQTVWGNITKIELLNTPTELKYAYSTNAITNGTILANKALLQKDYETAFASIAITKNAGAVVTAAAMFAPSAATTTTPLTVRITAVKRTWDVDVQLKSGTINKGFEAGKKHKITLVFKATEIPIEVLSTQIADWGNGNAVSSVVDPRSVRVVYGQPPFLNFIVDYNGTSLCGSTAASYNSWTGTVESTNNGQYITEITPETWDLERPYYSLDVGYGSENTTPVNWDQARKLCQDKTTDGGGWRLPRIAELMWIESNNLKATIPDYTKYTADVFSATEFNSNGVWSWNGTALKSLSKNTLLSFVRCVREAPMTTTPTLTMNYGKEPFSSVNALFGATSTETYNSWTRTVEEDGHRYYFEDIKDAYMAEKPFSRLEVAPTFETQQMIWDDARMACRNKTTDGGGWRLPRISELRWIYVNATKLSTVPNASLIGRPFVDNWRMYCWAATEQDVNAAFFYDFEDGEDPYYNSIEYKDQSLSVLCVRAFPFSMMTYGQAPFSATSILIGSTTDSYNSWKGTVANGGNGRYQVNEAAAVKDEKPYYKLEVALNDEAGKREWQSARETCWAKKTDGGGWRLPRTTELGWIFANRTELAKVAGFVPVKEEAYYASATEVNAAEVVVNRINTIGLGGEGRSKTFLLFVRCVREV